MRKLGGIILLAAMALLPRVALGDAQYYRYSDGRQLYYTRDNCIYRYSDGRQVLYYQGEDLKLTVFMVLMLADM